MHMIIDGIATNPYLMIGSYVLTAISFILAIAFYLKSKREKIPTFQTYSRTLIEGRDSELSDLKILYKNELQERVTVTKLAFWNAGRETINRVDIADSDILRIEVPAGVRVLDVKLLQQSELSNEFNLGSVENAANSENQSKIPLSFEYVDYRNAVVIQLVHTGDCATKMRLLGKIKGAERIARVSTVKSMGANDPLIKQFLLVLSRPKGIWKFGSLSYFVIGMVGLVLLLTGSTEWYAWALAGFGIPIALMFSIVLRPRSPIDLD